MAVADELAAIATVHDIDGARVIDAGVKQNSSLEAGVLLARICLADYAKVVIESEEADDIADYVHVSVDEPVAACMASQYAGWQISVGEYFAMGSGPFRAVYGKEKLFDDIGHREQSEIGVGVLETSKLPSAEVVKWIADKCAIETANLTLVVARTASIAGGIQIVARSVETAMHKLHELKFDLSRITHGQGAAPVPPVAKDDMAALGRTNDAVLYGAQVVLDVVGDDDSIIEAGSKLPSNTSADYGQPFAEIFKRYDHDFYKIDPMLFSPAQVTIHNTDTGSIHTFGETNHDVLEQSFFG
jgi:methenyltetrahydromethanopterin cyclohydrolase